MNRKGVILISALLATLVLATFLVSFYFQSISENQLATRFTHSTRAFWLAEEGVARVLGSPGLSTAYGSGSGNPPSTYMAVPSGPLAGTTNYYTVDSYGSVLLPSGESINRTVRVTVRTGVVDATKFAYGIETTTNLVIKGSSVDINPDESKKEFSTLDFSNLFGISKAAMKANATHLYNDVNFGAPVNGITWVDVASGSTLTIAGNLVGSGILVVNGNTHLSGTVTFNGIIYVIGELTMTGTVTTNGAVLAESSTTVDTELKGNVTINYSPADIGNALNNVQFLTKVVVAWQEV